MILRFDENDCRRAHDEWGCNCGPSALPAALFMTLDVLFCGLDDSPGQENLFETDGKEEPCSGD